jgi:hypothetical protein
MAERITHTEEGEIAMTRVPTTFRPYRRLQVAFATGFPYYYEVERAYAELCASGQIAPRTTHDQVEQDKGLLTRRGGYYSNLLDPAIGILKKTTGNNSLGYSVDLLIHRNGTFWDVATDAGGLAMPVNGGPLGPDPQLAADGWAQPTPELAGLTSEGGGADLTSQAPPYDEAKSIEFGNACNEVYTESGAPIDPGMIGVHSQRCGYSYYVAGIPWDECLAKHVNEFRAVYGLPPV